MPRIFHFELTAEEQVRGHAVIGDWRAGQPIHTFGDNFLGAFALLQSAQMLARVPSVGPNGSFVIGAATVEEVRQASGEEIATAYAAAQNTVRKLVHRAQLVQGPPPPLLNLPSIETALPFGIIAAAVVGVGAIAGATWWGIDRNEKVARVKMHAAEQAAQVDQYIRDLQVRAGAGQPLPPPPPTVKAASVAEMGYTPIQMGAAVLLALFAGKGVAELVKRPAPRRNPAPPRRVYRRRAAPRALPAARKPRKRAVPPGIKTAKKAATRRRRNPSWKRGDRAWLKINGKKVAVVVASKGASSQTGLVYVMNMAGATKGAKPADLSPRRKLMAKEKRGPLLKNPKAAPKKKRNAKKAPAKKRNAKKAAPKRKANPLASGYSQATVSKNVAKLRKEGKSAPIAAAIALRMARASWRKKHPRGGFPAHLQTAAERKGKAPAKKRNAHKAPAKKRNAKKSAPKRKANPTPPKGKTPRATFIRGQMRKGRSLKQATADWNGKQRLKKQRKGKGARRR